MSNEVNKARLALWNNLLRVPHRKIDEPIQAFRQALTDDPEFIGKACLAMTMPRFNKIRDLAEAGVVTLLTAPGQYQVLRRTGAYLLSRMAPYQVIRIDDYLSANFKSHPTKHTRRVINSFLDSMNANLHRIEGALGRPGNRDGLRRLAHRYHFPYQKGEGWLQTIVFERDAPAGTQSEILRKIVATEDPTEQAMIAAASKLSYPVLSSVLIVHPATVAVLVNAMTPQEALNSRGWLEEDGYLSNADIYKLWSDKVGRGKDLSAANIEFRASTQRGTDQKVQAVVNQAKEKVAKRERITRDILLIVDISTSMERAIDVAKRFGERVLSRTDGKILALACNTSARKIDLKDMSMLVPNGGTSLGCGLVYAQHQGFAPDTVVVITDDCERDRPLYPDQEAFADCEHMFVVIPSSDYVALRASHVAEAKGWKVQRFQVENDLKDYAALDQLVAVLQSEPGRTIVDEILDLEWPRAVRQIA
jgi:hypothetical protein